MVAEKRQRRDVQSNIVDGWVGGLRGEGEAGTRGDTEGVRGILRTSGTSHTLFYLHEE